VADINSFIVSGRLTSDAEIRATKSGKKLTMFNLASNDDYFSSETKDWVPRPYFFSVIFLGEKQIFKGTQVVVEGKITQEKFEKEGQAKTYYKVIASKVKKYEQKKANSEYVTDEATEVTPEIPF
jgi:single-strand DNA-binding protein